MKAWVVIFMLCCSFLASADELEERQLISDRAVTLFHSGQFAALEKDARQYRESGARTSSGLWKLSLFYGGLAKIPNEDVTAEEYWKGLEEKAQKWAGAYPNSPTGHLVYAEFLTAHAWMYRGEGWADEVRQEDWKPFREYYAEARKYLIAHKAIASRDPRWYELMIDIAKAEGWKMNKFNSLVDEATSRYPYFYQIYFTAIDYLTPKWHGSREEIENFAQKAVKITHGVDRDGIYSRLYWYASQTNYGEKLFTDSKIVWSKMSKSIDDVLRQYPDQWNINNFAYFSCLAGDAQKTSDLVSRVTGKPILDAWKSMAMYDHCKAWSAASQSGDKRQTGTQI